MHETNNVAFFLVAKVNPACIDEVVQGMHVTSSSSYSFAVPLAFSTFYRTVLRLSMNGRAHFGITYATASLVCQNLFYARRSHAYVECPPFPSSDKTITVVGTSRVALCWEVESPTQLLEGVRVH